MNMSKVRWKWEILYCIYIYITCNRTFLNNANGLLLTLRMCLPGAKCDPRHRNAKDICNHLTSDAWQRKKQTRPQTTKQSPAPEEKKQPKTAVESKSVKQWDKLRNYYASLRMRKCGVGMEQCLCSSLTWPHQYTMYMEYMISYWWYVNM